MFLKQTSPDSIVVGAPAKVNLFLEVLGKRKDGYHDINSLFQAVSLFDRLHFTRIRNSRRIEIHTNKATDIPLDDNNLISRAYQLMRDRYDLDFGLHVDLEKNIPVAAGLAGGSADGAATILACTVLADLPLSQAEMADAGLQIGSDLPFFFSRGQAIVRGRGEKLTETDFPTDYWLVLVTPDVAVSTAESYAALSLNLTKTKDPFTLRVCKTPEELGRYLQETGNDFEEIQCRSHPELNEISRELRGKGALLTRMSGSGPTVFGFYIDAPNQEGERLTYEGNWQQAIVRPVTLPARHP